MSSASVDGSYGMSINVIPCARSARQGRMFPTLRG
jgi:hypothetical protein